MNFVDFNRLGQFFEGVVLEKRLKGKSMALHIANYLN